MHIASLCFRDCAESDKIAKVDRKESKDEQNMIDYGAFHAGTLFE